MRELLAIVPRPGRYLGIEEGSVHHEDQSVTRLRCALAFPDLYEVGMSYLGQKILYDILNALPGIQAERVFAPCKEAAELLRSHNTPLATLESDIPLAHTQLIGFSITHELCFTNVLYMLDLAGIPLRAADRGTDLSAWPVVIAGGGCTLAAEPLAPFMDAMVLGEGEQSMPEVAACLHSALERGLSRPEFLLELARLPGLYVPSLFADPANGHAMQPVHPDLPRPTRRIMADMDEAAYPSRQVVPLGAVHNRLSLEVARGCTRGCRFCQAGMVYRPARERSLPNLVQLMESCLNDTGFDEVSFLSLSTGDFSALRTLFLEATDRCTQEQISVSLPSLRVGSVDDAIMERMAGIRRTGATLAPEAGSQRLRDVINKGITEEQILLHVRKLFAHGWQQIKLYFMIGLPGETDDDIQGIIDLCRKVRNAAPGGRGMPRLQVTAAISPFVPKPHTPFQWEAQISPADMHRRINQLREAFRTEKGLKLRWHEPNMSFLEGILARGDRRLSHVVEAAYRKGALFDAWMDHFSIQPWLEAMKDCGLDPADYTGTREVLDPLPWDHLEPGVSRRFLLTERQRALRAAVTPDCRYASCRQCGACTTKAGPSLLVAGTGPDLGRASIRKRLNFAQRDQAEQTETPMTAPAPQCAPTPVPAPAPWQPTAMTPVSLSGVEQDSAPDTVADVAPVAAPADKPSGRARKIPTGTSPELAIKAVRYRIWHAKEAQAAFISQLELQPLLERTLRRAGLPLAFSQGFHPLPLLSFGRALPVGVESTAEWFSVTLREALSAGQIKARLTPCMPRGMALDRIEPIPIHDKTLGAVQESFTLRLAAPAAAPAGAAPAPPVPDVLGFIHAWQDFAAAPSRELTRETKKGLRTADIRPMLASLRVDESHTLHLTMDWSNGYLSPLTLVRSITPDVGLEYLKLIKVQQVL